VDLLTILIDKQHYQRIIWISCNNLGPASRFVSIWAQFVSPGSQAKRTVPDACASRVRWYVIELCFFFTVDSRWILKHGFIFSEHIGRTLYRDSHHTKFFMQSFNLLNGSFHSNELRTKCGRFHGILPFGILHYRCSLHIDSDTSMWPSSYATASKVRTHKTRHHNRGTTIMWRYRLGSIRVKLRPITWLKSLFVYWQCLMIEYQWGSIIFFEVQKDICKTSFKCPSRGAAKKRDSIATLTMISIRPSSIIHLRTPMSPWK
jgi:hypothetical protein